MRPDRPPQLDRRAFVGASASCVAHLAFMTGTGRPVRAKRQQGRVVAREPWGRLEEVGEGLWPLVSDPLQDRTTLCNGGIVAGQQGVVIFEGFGSADGARWMAEQAQRLTGRPPTHVVLSHFHGDHTGGFEGYDNGIELYVTARTRDLVLDGDRQRGGEGAERRARMLADASVVDPAAPTRIDLGGREIWIEPAGGHTPSDIVIAMREPSVVWCGDLVWNNMFPNYRDAIPSWLSRSVRRLKREQDTLYVPGHGELADNADLDRYTAVIDHVEEAGRRAFEAGVPAAEAAQSFTLPASLGEWMRFSERYYEVALGAWERELRGDAR